MLLDKSLIREWLSSNCSALAPLLVLTHRTAAAAAAASPLLIRPSYVVMFISRSTCMQHACTCLYM